MNKHILLAILGTSTLILTSSNIAAKIYKWQDAQGTVHYTATPPPQQYKAQDIEDKINLSLGKHRPEAAAEEKEEQEFEEEKTSQSSKTDSDKLNKARIKRCKNLRSNLSTLQENDTVVSVDDKQNEVTLSGNSRLKRIKKVRQRISNECKDT